MWTTHRLISLSYFAIVASNMMGHYVMASGEDISTCVFIQQRTFHCISVAALCCFIFWVEQYQDIVVYLRLVLDRNDEDSSSSSITYQNHHHQQQIVASTPLAVHLSEHRFKYLKILVLFMSFLLRYQQLFFMVCRNHATERLFEKNYIVHMDRCPSDYLTKFYWWKQEGYDPRSYSPKLSVYIDRDPSNNLVIISPEEASKTIERKLMGHLFENNNDSFQNDINSNGDKTKVMRLENIPCSDLHILKSLPERKKQIKEKEQNSIVYAFIMKLAKVSQEASAFIFDCDRNGYHENYQISTHDLFCFLFCLALMVALL